MHFNLWPTLTTYKYVLVVPVKRHDDTFWSPVRCCKESPAGSEKISTKQWRILRSKQCDFWPEDIMIEASVSWLSHGRGHLDLQFLIFEFTSKSNHRHRRHSSHSYLHVDQLMHSWFIVLISEIWCIYHIHISVKYDIYMCISYIMYVYNAL